MQQVQNCLDFNIDTPSDEELRRKFQEVEKLLDDNVQNKKHKKSRKKPCKYEPDFVRHMK